MLKYFPMEREIGFGRIPEFYTQMLYSFINVKIRKSLCHKVPRPFSEWLLLWLDR